MACNGDIGATFQGGRWEEFCKDKATSAARTFSREFLQFVSFNPVYDTPGASSTFSKRFVEYFVEAFDHEVHKTNGIMHHDFGPPPDSPLEDFGEDEFGSNIHLTSNSKHQQAKKAADSSFRFNFSKKFRDVRGLFKRSASLHDDDPSAQKSATTPDQSRRKSSTAQPTGTEEARNKSVSGLKREGIMNYLMNLDMGVNTEDFFWQKCRVVLFKAPGGYMLEFYTPPKVRLKHTLGIARCAETEPVHHIFSAQENFYKSLKEYFMCFDCISSCRREEVVKC